MARPKLKPTKEKRTIVRSLAAYGFRHETIARAIGIRSPKSLRKHYREELDRGQLEANAKVAQTAFQMASSGQHPVMTIYWLKCRAGWKESRDSSLPVAPPAFIVAQEAA
jgi:hypothetical protein